MKIIFSEVFGSVVLYPHLSESSCASVQKGQKKTNLEGFSLDKKTFLIDETVNLAVIFSQTRAYLRRKINTLQISMHLYSYILILIQLLHFYFVFLLWHATDHRHDLLKFGFSSRLSGVRWKLHDTNKLSVSSTN